MIILIGSEKGGVGKSTVAMNLAVWLSSKGKEVLVVDADRQSSIANWAQVRDETDKVKIVCARQYDNLTKTLQNFSSHYNMVIVDCQGRISKEMQTGLLAADLAIIPFRPSQMDLDTIPSMAELIESTKIFNPKLNACALLTMCPTNTRVNELSEARDFFDNYPSLSLLDNVLRDRKVYRDAVSAGLGVIEMDNKIAAEEVDTVFKEIITLQLKLKKEMNNGDEA